jgi:hypothetical protein
MGLSHPEPRSYAVTDLLFVLATVGFFALCVLYTYAFGRI